MAENIVALNLNGDEYAFRPLYSLDSAGSLRADDDFPLNDFDAVDGATFLLYFATNDLISYDAPILFDTNGYFWQVFYGDRQLTWRDLVPYNIYEFSCHVDSDRFYLTGNIPKTSIKYRDSKNQLRSLVIGDSSEIDLSGGVYYATTSATATRVANTLTLTAVNGDVQTYNGSSPIDLSAGVNYARHAELAAIANHASTAKVAHSLSADDTPIPGGHVFGEYCHIGSVNVYEIKSGNCSILFTGHGFNTHVDVSWSGILYFEWHNNTTDSIRGSAKWMCLTRPDLSNKILLTVENVDSTHKLLHICLAYPNTYVSADVTLIKGSNVNFDIYTSMSLIGTTIATSTFDSGSSAGNLYYQILDDSGSQVWASSVDLENEPFIFRPGPNINIFPTSALDSNTNGVFIKLSDDFTQAFVQLQQYVQILQYTVANQKQQIADLKSVLTEITTGKTWDDNIWGSTAGQGSTIGIMTNEHEFIDIHPL